MACWLVGWLAVALLLTTVGFSRRQSLVVLLAQLVGNGVMMGYDANAVRIASSYCSDKIVPSGGLCNMGGFVLTCVLDGGSVLLSFVALYTMWKWVNLWSEEDASGPSQEITDDKAAVPEGDSTKQAIDVEVAAPTSSGTAGAYGARGADTAPESERMSQIRSAYGNNSSDSEVRPGFKASTAPAYGGDNVSGSGSGSGAGSSSTGAYGGGGKRRSVFEGPSKR